MTENDDPFLTVVEIAKELRISKMSIYRLMRDGELKHLRIGRTYRSRRSWLDAYLREHTT